MVYNIIKNILHFSFLYFILWSCVLKNPEPDIDIIANTSLKVTPNKKSIKIGDTLNFKLDVSDIFPTVNGGTKKIENWKYFFKIQLCKLGKTQLESGSQDNTPKIDYYALPTDLMWKTNAGTLETNSSGKLWKCNVKYSSGRYILDFDLIPTIKDTFFVWVTSADMRDYNNTKFIRPEVNFVGNNQHLDAILYSFYIPDQTEEAQRQRRETYAFIVE